MGYAADYQPSVLALARSGNFQAIAYWLNVLLLPHNLYAKVNPAPQPGCIQVFVEFQPSAEVDAQAPEFRNSLVRFICHHIWKLNSDVIDGVQIVACYIGQPQPLWRQTVRVVSPARRVKLNQAKSGQTKSKPPQSIHPKAAAHKNRPVKSRVAKPGVEDAQLKTRIRQVTRQKLQFRAIRSLLLTGTTAAAFIMGCWLGYMDSPSEQTNASASSSPTVPVRPDTISAALESVPAEKLQTNSADDGTATLMFAGDVALNGLYSNSIGSEHNWAFSALGEARQADVMMVNLEAPFTTATIAEPTQADPYKADPDKVNVLKNGGVDLVNLANNRTMDYQSAGLEETLKTLEQAGIRHLGAGRNVTEARRPEVLDVNGQRIAYFGYYDADLHAATENQPGTNIRQNDRIAADIKAIRDQVDWVVVNFHWGSEISRYPSDTQIDLARFTIDQGADLVVGHHSSILQGAEVYKGRPIVYSLGNFIFGGEAHSNSDTAMLKVALKDKQMKVELLPVEVKGFQPRVVSGDRAQEILQQIENVSDIFQQPLKSSVILDARENKVISQPENLTVPATQPAEEQSPPADSQPSNDLPANSQPSENLPADIPPAPEATSSPTPDSELSTPESQPTPEASPEATSSPAPENQSESQPQPTVTPTESGTPITPASPSSGQSSDQPWGDSFISNPTASPSPLVPQQSPAPVPSAEGISAPADTQGAIEPSVSPSPTHYLEPLKRRYADASSNLD